MDRGVPQGAPESPMCFIQVVEMVLRGLQVTWNARGSGWLCDQMQLVDVCFADDVILFSTSRDDVVRMLVGTRDALRSVGPDAGMENTGPAGHKNRVRPYALMKSVYCGTRTMCLLGESWTSAETAAVRSTTALSKRRRRILGGNHCVPAGGLHRNAERSSRFVL